VIVYSLREEHVEAITSPGTERVHVTIAPNEAPKADGAGTNKPKPTAAVPPNAPVVNSTATSTASGAEGAAAPVPATSQAAAPQPAPRP